MFGGLIPIAGASKDHDIFCHASNISVLAYSQYLYILRI